MKDIAKLIVYGGIFAIPFLVLIVQNEMFFPYITGKNFWFRGITEVIFGAWLILALYDVQYRPKNSWLIGSFVAFLVVMFLANFFGESRLSGFWSNFERMEGYMALLHTGMYFVVTASVLTTDKLWNRYFMVQVGVATLVSFIAFAQVGGFVEHRYQGFRADATLGNATYMAVYMLFSAFTALILAVRSNSRGMKYALAFLALLFMLMIVQTATRGTTLGLVVGLFVSALYIGLQGGTARKIALRGLLAATVVVVVFIGMRDSSFVQNSPTLNRIASISLSEGDVRFKVWHMAYEGFKERPLLGWGQSGFSYVFNKNYDPSIYYAESWYDRVHNIVFDWLIAGGILGAVTYFAIFFSALYYLFIRPITQNDTSFSVAERGILIGLLIGYLFHNMFVFDNIVSYIYYGTILAFIHARIGIPWKDVTALKFNTNVIEQVAVPIIGVAVVLTLYFVNVPGIRAAGDIIDAFQATTSDTMMSTFERALDRNSFGDQEIREQMTRRAQEVIFNKEVPQETKDVFTAKVEDELLKQIEEKPNDARAHVFIASFYRSLGTPEALEKAVEQLERARELSPKKQQIIFEQGLTELQKQNYQGAFDLFKEAYELEQTYLEARVFYAMGAIATGKYDLVDELIQTDESRAALYTNDLVIQVTYTQKHYELLKKIFSYRIEKNPTDSQLRTNLAYVLNESGDTEGAVAVLKKAGEDIPEFKAQADGFMAQIVKDNVVKNK